MVVAFKVARSVVKSLGSFDFSRLYFLHTYYQIYLSLRGLPDILEVPMDGTSSTDKKKLYGGLYLVLFVIILTAIIPSSLLNPTTKKPRPFKRIDVSGIGTTSPKIRDTNADGEISWSEAISSSLADSTSTLELIKDNPIDPKAIAQLNDPNNLTGSFSKNLFLATTQLRQQGAVDEATKQKTIAYLMKQEATKINQTPYALKDLQIAQTESKSSIKAYGNAVAPLVKNILSEEVITSDLTNLALYTQSLNESDLLPIIKNRDRINVILQKLLLIKAPPSAASYHLLAINRIAFYKNTLDSFGKTAEDPVRSTLMFNSYETTLLLLARIPSRFAEYFKMQNVVFGTNEAGYLFTSGYSYE